MTTKMVIDKKQATAFIRRTGRLKPGEMLQGTKELISDPLFKNMKKSLGDVSKADFSDISTDELEFHARYCRDKFKGLKIALVAPSDLLYGLTRRFEILSEMDHLLVTRDMDEALSWLEVALPEELQ